MLAACVQVLLRKSNSHRSEAFRGLELTLQNKNILRTKRNNAKQKNGTKMSFCLVLEKVNNYVKLCKQYNGNSYTHTHTHTHSHTPYERMWNHQPTPEITILLHILWLSGQLEHFEAWFSLMKNSLLSVKLQLSHIIFRSVLQNATMP